MVFWKKLPPYDGYPYMMLKSPQTPRRTLRQVLRDLWSLVMSDA